MVGVPQGDDNTGASLTWLVNVDFKGMVPAGLLSPSLQVNSTFVPRCFSTLLTARVFIAFAASLSVELMYLPALYVRDIKEERDKEARAAAQEQGQGAQDDERLLLAAAREEIAALKAEITALRLATQKEA